MTQPNARTQALTPNLRTPLYEHAHKHIHTRVVAPTEEAMGKAESQVTSAKQEYALSYFYMHMNLCTQADNATSHKS